MGDTQQFILHVKKTFEKQRDKSLKEKWRGRLSESERDTETALISWLAPLRCMLKTQGRSLMQVAMNQLLAPSPVTSQGLHCQEAGVRKAG